MQLELEEPALHPEGLLYIRACHVVKPEGLSKDSVLSCKTQFGIWWFWVCWRQLCGRDRILNTLSQIAVPKYRVARGEVQLWRRLRSYSILPSESIREKLFTIQNGLNQLFSKLAKVFYWSLGRNPHPRVLSFLKWACSSWEVKVLA